MEKSKKTNVMSNLFLKKLTPEGPFLDWFVTRGVEWSQGSAGAGHSAYKWIKVPDKGLYSKPLWI